MSLLSDNDALRTKRWLQDIENDFAAPELINPYMRGVIDYNRQRINEYEEDAALNNRPAYKPDPKRTLENIPYYQGAMTEGGEQYFGKDFTLYDTNEKRADIIAPYYISDLHGLNTSEIKEKLPSYKQYYMNKHGVNNFATALQMDMEETNEKSNLMAEIYEHAQLSSARSASDIEYDRFKAMSEFIDSKGEDFSMDTELSELYRDSYLKNLEIYKTNSQSFEKLSASLKEATEGTLNTGNIFKAALDLHDIDPKYRGHALKYAEQQIPGGKEAIKRLFGITSEAIRERTGSDYMDVVQNIREMAKQMASGGEIEVARGRKLKTGSAFDALMNISTSERADWVQFFTRYATEEEKDILWRDMQSAGDYASVIDDIEDFVKEKTTDVSQLDGAIERHIWDKMLFPAMESLPYMVEYGSYAIGGFGVGLGIKTIGVGSKVVRGGVSTALIVNGTERAYARNHFKELVKEFPEMDKGLALSVAQWQGRAEAGVAALGNIIQLRQLPQPLRKALTGSVAGAMKKTIIGRTTTIFGVEVMEEILQEVSAGATRNIYSAFFNEDVPIKEHLIPTLEEVGDIAWAVLPMAMLGGVSGKFLKPDAKAQLLSDRNRLMKTFGDEEIVDKIINAETVSEKEAIYKANYSAKRHAELIREAVDDGATTSDFVSEEAVAAAKEADAIEADPELREPQVIPIDLEPGQTEQKYAVVYEDGRKEVHDSFASAVERLVDYKETGEVQAELDTKKLLDLDTEKAQIEQEIAELEAKREEELKPKPKPKSIADMTAEEKLDAYDQKRKSHIALNKDPYQRGQDSKGHGHKVAAIRRKLRGKPTGNEVGREMNRLSKPRQGDVVEVKGLGEVEIIGYGDKPQAYGKTKVKDKSGKEHTVEWQDIIKPEATEQQAIESLRKQAEEEVQSLVDLFLKDEAKAEVEAKAEPKGAFEKAAELEKPERRKRDIDAQIEAKRKRLADIEKESKALKAKPKLEPKPQPKAPKGSKVKKERAVDGKEKDVIEPDKSDQTTGDAKVAENITSLTKDEIGNIRERFGMEELDPTIKRSWEEELHNAKAKKLDVNALTYARAVLENKDFGVLTAENHAAMVIEQARLEKEYEWHEQMAADMIESGFVAEAKRQQELADGIFDNIEMLTRATSMVSSEAGRALNARKIAVEGDRYTLVKVQQRLLVAKKNDLTKEEKALVKKLTKEIDRKEKVIRDLQDKMKDMEHNQDKKEARETLKGWSKEKLSKDPEALEKEARKRMEDLGFC